MNKHVPNRKQLQTILKYYLNNNDTDITSFSQDLTDSKREYAFTFQPNPTTALDLDANSIKCAIILDREIGVYYITIGTYKEVITEYDYKNLKETYFGRNFLYENYRKSDTDVDKLIQFTYDSMMNKKKSLGRNLHNEPTNIFAEEPMEMVAEDPVRATRVFEETNIAENDAIRDIVAERKDIPYDAMGTYEGPDEDRG